MKKSLLLVGAVILVAELAYAQTLIPKAGLTLSKIAFKNHSGVKSKIGFTFAVGYNIAISDLLSIQPELSFVQKGVKGKSTETQGSVTETLEDDLTINYLELPVLARLAFAPGSKFYLNAGPSIGLGVGGKYKYTETYRRTYQGDTHTEIFESIGKIKFGDEPDNYQGEDTYFDNRLDIGIQVGGGAIIADKIMIDVRYGFGFSNLVDGEDNKSQNRVIQFTVGIPISLK